MEDSQDSRREDARNDVAVARAMHRRIAHAVGAFCLMTHVRKLRQWRDREYLSELTFLVGGQSAVGSRPADVLIGQAFIISITEP